MTCIEYLSWHQEFRFCLTALQQQQLIDNKYINPRELLGFNFRFDVGTLQNEYDDLAGKILPFQS
jgi:hypothetical protein